MSIYGTNDGRKTSLEVGPWYGVWGPLVQTSLDAYQPTNVSYIADPGQKAKMCMLYMTVTWPNGPTQKYPVRKQLQASSDDHRSRHRHHHHDLDAADFTAATGAP